MEVVLRQAQVQARTGLSRSAIYAKQRAGEFPGSISLGAKSVGWLQSEIDSWIAARVAASRNANNS